MIRFDRKHISYPKAALATAALVAMLCVSFWDRLVVHSIIRIPTTFKYDVSLDSTESRYDSSAQTFGEVERTKVKFQLATERITAGTAFIKHHFSVRDATGEEKVRVERRYGIDRQTGEHIKDVGDRARTGYLFGPRHAQKHQFIYWHAKYDTPLTMNFAGSDFVGSLELYRYESHFSTDQTSEMTRLLALPKDHSLEVEGVLKIWIEPTSGWLVKYQEDSTEYLTDSLTRQRVQPWLKFSDRYTEAAAAEQAERAEYLRTLSPSIETLLPMSIGALSILALLVAVDISSILLSIGVVITICGATIVLGWFVNAESILRVHPSLIAVKFNTALCILCSGFAMLCLHFNKRTSGLLLSAFIGGIGACTLAQCIFNVDLGVDELFYADLYSIQTIHPGRMATSTALCLTLIAISIAMGFYDRYRSRFIFWLFPVWLVGLGILLTTSYLLNLSITTAWPRTTFIAYHAAISVVLIGAALSIHALRNTKSEERIRAIPSAIAVVSLIISLVVHAKLVEREREDYQMYLRLESNTLSRAITEAIYSRINSFSRMVNQWKGSNTVSIEHWLQEAAEQHVAFPGYHSIVMFDPSLNPVWFYPQEHKSDPLTISPRLRRSLHNITTAANGQRGVITGAVWVKPATPVFLIIEPYYSKEYLSGYIVGLIDVDSFFSSVIFHETRDYSLRVTDSDQVIYVNSTEENQSSALEEDSVMTLPGLQWTFHVTPRSSGTPRIQYLIPKVITAITFALGICLAIAIGFYLMAVEKNLKAQNAELALSEIIDHLPHAVFVKEAKQLRFTHLNRAGVELFGIKKEDFIGKCDHDFFPVEQADFFNQNDRQVLTSGEEIEVMEEALETKKLGPRWLHTRKVAIPDANGVPAFLLGVSEDITEQKRIQDQIRLARDEAIRASRVKSEFVANMSHEIRTPMNGVIGMTELLLDTPLTEEQRELALTAKESASALLRVINDILDFSKIEAGKLVLSSGPFSLDYFIQQLERMHIPRAKAKHISFHITRNPDVPLYLIGDVDRLRQVVINLLGNALKFTHDGGEISVTISKITEGEGDVVLSFSVKDTGIGIPKEKQAQIFEAFSQVDTSSTRSFGGTGLGLSISSRIVELMGGTLSVESELEKGATFTVVIPFSRATIEQIAVIEHSMAEDKSGFSRGNGARVLLAEDDVTNQRLAQLILERAGYGVAIARNGKEAVELFAAEGFDLILMDMQMPELSGEDAVKLIRKTLKGEKIPIIALTAHAMSGDKERYLNQAIDGYVSKPLERKILLDTIKSLIESSQHH